MITTDEIKTMICTYSAIYILWREIFHPEININVGLEMYEIAQDMIIRGLY